MVSGQTKSVDGRTDGRNGRTDDAKTIYLQLRRGIKNTNKTKVIAQNKHMRAYVVLKYSFKNNNCIRQA